LTQLRRATHHAVNKKAMHDGVERKRQIHKIADEVVGHSAAKAAVPARRIEPQQMIAVFVMFADPQLADYAAVGKNFLHSRGLLVEGPLDRVLPSGRVAVKTVPIPHAYVQNHRHYIMLGVAKFWQGEALSNMPAFRIRMAD
jgi:hypothetical protein